jgi:hypothetical protein
MNLRHAAALALVGWYLIFPPPQSDSKPEEISFEHWSIAQSFDQAASCERAKKLMMAQALKHPINEDGLTKEELMAVNKYLAPSSFKAFKAVDMNPQANAICIATDDPRLK